MKHGSPMDDLVTDEQSPSTSKHHQRTILTAAIVLIHGAYFCGFPEYGVNVDKTTLMPSLAGLVCLKVFLCCLLALTFAFVAAFEAISLTGLMGPLLRVLSIFQVRCLDGGS